MTHLFSFQAITGALLIGALCTVSTSAALNLGGSVSVGGKSIPDPVVKDALNQCTLNEPDLVPAQCLDQYFAPRWLLDKSAQETRLALEPAMQYLKADLLHQGLQEHFAQQIVPSKKDVSQYIEKHKRDFVAPLRIRVFRILLNSKEEAREVLSQLKPTTTVKEFRELAREKSVDRATNERGGDLGFLWPDGSTDVPQVRVEKGIYAAALSLSEGEFSPDPTAEEKNFAILWRRGSKPALELTQERRRIASLRVTEAQTEEKLKALLDSLKKEFVSERKNIRLGKLRRKKAKLFEVP